MIPKQELIGKIRQYFNLNIYETKVWLALLQKGIAAAGEIAELSNVPRSRTYDVLESLEKQGFAIAKVGKPTKYIAVKPHSVIERIKKSTSAKAEEKVSILENLKSTKEYAELESIHNSSTSQIKIEDISGAIKGRALIMSHAREILENANKEVIICMPASEFIERSRIFSGLFALFSSNKISCKVALNGTDEEVRKAAEKYKIKPYKTSLNSKFFIIDRKQVLFSLTETRVEEDETAIWLNSEFFSASLANLFDLSVRA